MKFSPFIILSLLLPASHGFSYQQEQKPAADAKNATQKKPDQKPEPMSYKADSSEFLDKENVYILMGNVLIERGSMKMLSRFWSWAQLSLPLTTSRFLPPACGRCLAGR